MKEQEKENYDVVILGGGLAGLCLARQLHREVPAARLLVVERRGFPVPEAAHKVGESSVEVGAHYLGKRLGLEDHLAGQQLPKMGLRFFFSSPDNRDISQRAELGATGFPPVPAFQLDRGRLENHLAETLRADGVEVMDGCSAGRLELGDDGAPHHLTLFADGGELRVAARWLVDASGRARVLAHHLDLGTDVGHTAHAAWFRVASRIDIGTWSRSADWHQQVRGGPRLLSTNHLCGDGYWVWLIPLSSGATSVGLVVEGDAVAPSEINRLEKVMAFLERHEPEVFAEVEARRGEVMDFRTLRHYSYGARQVFSPQRWALVGEAAFFNDPFYSPGSDFIALANNYVTALVASDLAGEPVEALCHAYDRTLLGTFEQSLTIYRGYGEVLGHADAMISKVVWDNGGYWGLFGLLYFHGKLTDIEFLARASASLERFRRLSARMQSLFIAWSRGSRCRPWGAFRNMLAIDELRRLHVELEAGFDDETLLARLETNVETFEELARQMLLRAARAVGLAQRLEGRALDPYAASLDPEAWERDGLFDGPRAALPGQCEIDLALMTVDDGARERDAEPAAAAEVA